MLKGLIYHLTSVSNKHFIIGSNNYNSKPLSEPRKSLQFIKLFWAFDMSLYFSKKKADMEQIIIVWQAQLSDGNVSESYEYDASFFLAEKKAWRCFCFFSII